MTSDFETKHSHAEGKIWSAKKLAILPFLAVVILYGSYDFARKSFFFCQTGHCQESIPGNLWKVLKLDTDLDASNLQATGATKEEAASREFRLREANSARYTGRMTWYFLAMVYIFVCVGSLIVAALITCHLFPDRRVFYLAALLGLSAAVGLVLYLNPDVHMVIFSKLFKLTIVKDVFPIERITNLLNSIGNAVAFSLMLASCATLLPSHDRRSLRGLKQLSTRMSYARAILYAGTFLLVTTVILKSSLFQWSLAFTSHEPQLNKVAMSFVSNLLSVEGGFYTLVLIAVYVPAAFVLQKRTAYLNELPIDDTERAKLLSQHRMTFSFTESLPRILAILGPVLAGPIGQFFSRNW
jgi:hypothetical protein